MAAIFHAPLHHIAIHYIGITRDFFHKTAILPVTLILNLFSAIPGGKGLWQMPRSLKGDCKQKWKYQMGIITLQMWVTCHQMKTSLLLTVVSGIILWSGARLIKSKRLYLVSNFTLINMFRPWTKEKLFNLHNTSACNVIECIFGILKWKFQILHLGPEYSLDIQTCIPAALAAIHNFTYCHKHEEEEEDEGGDSVANGSNCHIYHTLSKLTWTISTSPVWPNGKVEII